MLPILDAQECQSDPVGPFSPITEREIIQPLRPKQVF